MINNSIDKVSFKKDTTIAHLNDILEKSGYSQLMVIGENDRQYGAVPIDKSKNMIIVYFKKNEMHFYYLSLREKEKNKFIVNKIKKSLEEKAVNTEIK